MTIRADHSGIAVGGNNYGILNTGVLFVIVAGQMCQSLSILWRTPKADDFQLLKWDASITKLHGREQELQKLYQWATTGEPIQAKFIIGEGGAGKSRLAMELGKLLQNEGWAAGKLDLDKEGEYALGEKGTLLIIDYPEENRENVRSFLKELGKAEDVGIPLRVLLLSRNNDDFWQNDLDESDASVFFAGQRQLYLRGLSGSSDPYKIFSEAWQTAGRIFNSASVLPGEEEFLIWLKKSPLHSLPLFTIACAIQHHHAPDTLTLNGSKIIDGLVRRELRRLRNESRSAGLGEKGLPRLLALAALLQGLSTADLKSIAKNRDLEIVRCDEHDIIDVLAESGRLKAGSLPPLEPDIVSAGLLYQVLKEREDMAPEWLWFALHRDPAKALKAFGRLGYDSKYVLGHSGKSLPSLLASALRGQRERCEFAERAFVEAENSICFAEAKAAICTVLAESSASGIARAHYLDQLSLHLKSQGKYQAAFDASTKSVEILEAEFAGNRGCQVDLANSLDTLGSVQMKLGRLDEAKKSARRAFDLYHDLPVPPLSSLGVNLCTLALIHAELRQHDEELAATTLAIDIYSHLAQDKPAYESTLAGCLNNVGNAYANKDQYDKSLDALERAAKIYRSLADASPDSYEPSLAKILSNLGVTYMEIDRNDEALNSFKESVAIYEILSKANPVQYEPELAGTLNNFGKVYSALGRGELALSNLNDSVKMYRRLAQHSPDGYNPKLALSLHNLGNAYGDLGLNEEALAAQETAIDIYSRLAQEHPATYNVLLAKSQLAYSDTCLQVGDLSKGLEPCRDALRKFAKLAADAPDEHEPDVAWALNTIAGIYANLQEYVEALFNIQQAIALFKRLVEKNPQKYSASLANCEDNLDRFYSSLGQPNVSMGLSNVASRYSELGMHQQALNACEQSVELYEASGEKDEALLAALLGNLGNKYAILERFDEGIKTAQRGIEIYRRLGEGGSVSYAYSLLKTLENLIRMYMDAGRDNDAYNAALQAIELKERLDLAHLLPTPC